MKTMAGRLQLVMELLGGEDILDQNGEPTGEKTPPIISIEDAKKLLGFDDETK